jgi:hypothetical protein
VVTLKTETKKQTCKHNIKINIREILYEDDSWIEHVEEGVLKRNYHTSQVCAATHSLYSGNSQESYI